MNRRVERRRPATRIRPRAGISARRRTVAAWAVALGLVVVLSGTLTVSEARLAGKLRRRAQELTRVTALISRLHALQTAVAASSTTRSEAPGSDLQILIDTVTRTTVRQGRIGVGTAPVDDDGNPQEARAPQTAPGRNDDAIELRLIATPLEEIVDLLYGLERTNLSLRVARLGLKLSTPRDNSAPAPGTLDATIEITRIEVPK